MNLSTGEYEHFDDDTGKQPRRTRNPLVVIVVPAESYRAIDFVAAAQSLRVDLIVASDGDLPMGDLGRSRSMTIDFTRPEWSAAKIAKISPRPDTVLAVDDRGVMIATLASTLLGIPSNPTAGIAATRDKATMRGLLDSAGVSQPAFRIAGPGDVVARAGEIGYPCVVKPRGLSASRGVIRVDDAEAAGRAEERIRTIIADAGGDRAEELLVEEFITGPEVAVEGMIVDGTLTVLALLDKPDPLDGPYFEETMFVTPSRHEPHIQAQIVASMSAATAALGLVTGPVHGEVRIGPGGVEVIEVAARPIGGLCGRALTFGLLGESLESVIIRSALGLPGSGLDSSATATGVLMIPIPTAGKLVSIDGVDEALAVDGITEFDQTIADGRAVVPLPEGTRYLGFLFATGRTPDDVEHSLRQAHATLDIRIDSEAVGDAGAAC